MNVQQGLATLLSATLLLVTAAQAETIGDPLVAGAQVDTAQGAIFVENQGFTAPFNYLGSFGFYDDIPGNNGLVLTPLILQLVGSTYFITGVGAPVANASTGAQTFNFNLTAGSDQVGPGYFFGYKNGTDADSTQTGLVEFSFINSPVPSESFFGVNFSNNLIPGTNLGAGTFLGPNLGQDYRIYSVQATSVPEPTSMVLFGLGAIGLVRIVRRRRA